MYEKLYFQNDVAYMSVNPEGEIISRGGLRNVTGYNTRDSIMRGMTTPPSVSVGTLLQSDRMYFRLDGNTTIGSFAQYVAADSATALSTRYNSATYVTSVMFNATYTATANVTCKNVVLTLGARSAGDDVGSFSDFWSTNFNMGCGSGGKLIIQWTISMP
jgi:hypothetical protein